MDAEHILSGLVRVGTVTDINKDEHKARVKFHAEDLTSGWLYVLDTHPHIPDFDPADQQTEYEAGGSGSAAYESHKHDLIIKQWMPNIDDVVVVLYLPIFNADGFVIGGIS